MNICCFFWLSCWCNWGYCWGVCCFYFCAISILSYNFRWIWCTCEVFVWLECDYSCCWINCICSNFFSIFCCWKSCYFVTTWVYQFNSCLINWGYFVTFFEHCLSFLSLWLTLFSRCFFWFCCWCNWGYCWGVCCFYFCSVSILRYNFRWIWCTCEIFVWLECNYSCCWINCVCSNFFSIFCCWKSCYFVTTWVYQFNSCLINWGYFVTFFEHCLSFLSLWLTLFSRCFFWFCCWCNWGYCWGVCCFYFCSVSILRYNFRWIWCTCEIFVWLECNYSCCWINCVCSNFFSIFCCWKSCYFITTWVYQFNSCLINWGYFITFFEH